MKSKVDILAYDSTYQWDRYETGPARLFQWQKYNYEMEYHYYYKNYPTMELDRDYLCYGEYITKPTESCYANYKRIPWQKFGAHRIWYWSEGSDNPIISDDYDINFISNSELEVLNLESDMMVRGEDWIEEREINRKDKWYVEKPFGYQFNQDVVYNYYKYTFSPPSQIAYWFVYDGQDHDGYPYYRTNWVDWNEYDLTTLYAGVDIYYDEDKTIKVINSIIGPFWDGIDYKRAFNKQGVVFWDYFVKHKTSNQYIKTNIVRSSSSEINNYPNILHLGKSPNSSIIRFADMLMYPVNLYECKIAKTITSDDEITTGRYSSKILVDIMSKEFEGFTTQPDSRYSQIGPMRGETKDRLIFKYSDTPIDISDKNKYTSYGIISRGTLVPFKWHVSFCRAAEPHNFSRVDERYSESWQNHYDCWDYQAEQVPQLNALWGYEDDGITYFEEKVYDSYSQYHYVEHYYIDDLDELDLLEPLDLNNNRGLSGIKVNGTKFNQNPPRAGMFYRHYFGEDHWYMLPLNGRWDQLDVIEEFANPNKEKYDGYAIKYNESDGSIIVKDKAGVYSSYDRNKYPDNDIYNGFYLEFKGSALIPYSKVGTPTPVYSTIKDAFPLNGLSKQGDTYYWYVFRHKTYTIARTYDNNELLGNVELTQSAGSENSFSVGNIGGASVSFDVLKPLTEVLPYYNFDILITYTFGGGDIVQEGLFTIKEITENGLNKTHVVAYDATHKLDIQFKPLADKLSFPITAQRLFNTICAYCDIIYQVDFDFMNDDAVIEEAFGDDKTTCREVMEWIAQIAGGIIIVDEDGYLQIKRMAQEEYSRGSRASDTYSLDVSMLPVQKPTAIQYKIDDDNTKLVIADKAERISILDYSDNPFTFYSDKDVVDTWLKNTVNSISALGDIYAFEVKISHDWWNIQCGDSWVVSSNSVVPRRGVVQNKKIDSSGVIYTSSGEIVSISSDKALNDREIEKVVSDIERMYSLIRVDGFVVKDSLYDEPVITIDEGYIFTPENTSYLNSQLSFDISAQYDSLYLGLPVEVLLDSGETCECYIEDGIMYFISNESIPLRLRDITLTVVNENDVVEGTYPPDKIQTYNGDNSFETLISPYLWLYSTGAPSIPPLQYLIQKLAYLSNEEELEFISTPNKGLYNAELDMSLDGETEISVLTLNEWDKIIFSYENHILTLKYIIEPLDHDIIINNITINNYNLTITNYRTKNPITFPLTIPSGTFYFEFPEFEITYNDYDYFIGIIRYNSDINKWVLWNYIDYPRWTVDSYEETVDSNGILGYSIDTILPAVKRVIFHGTGNNTKTYDTDVLNNVFLSDYRFNTSNATTSIYTINTHKWGDTNHTYTVKSGWTWYPKFKHKLKVQGYDLAPTYYIEYSIESGVFQAYPSLNSSAGVKSCVYNPTTYTLEVNA